MSPSPGPARSRDWPHSRSGMARAPGSRGGWALRTVPPSRSSTVRWPWVPTKVPCSSVSLPAPPGSAATGLMNPGGRASEAAQHGAELAGLDGHTVAERHDLARGRREARTRQQDPHQVERVGGRHDDQLARLVAPPDGTQRLDRLGQRELLADEPGDEAAASHLAARLERTQRAEQRPPRGDPRLARRQLACHDAVAAEGLAPEGRRPPAAS